MLTREEFHLTKAEILENVRLLTLLGQYEHEEQVHLKPAILQEIQKTDPVILIKMTLTNPVVEELCHDDALVNFWNSVWRMCGLNDVENESGMRIDRGYLPLSNLHSFDLVKGIYFYWLYQSSTALGDAKAHDYFSQALASNCFVAIYQHAHHQLEIMKNEFSYKVAEELIQVARRAAHLYLAPGYVLQAEVCAGLATAINEQYHHRSNVKSWVFHLAGSALRSLYVADHFMEYSEASIANVQQMLKLSGLPLFDLPSVRAQLYQCVIAIVPELKLQDQELHRKAKDEFEAVQSKQEIAPDHFPTEFFSSGLRKSACLSEKRA